MIKDFGSFISWKALYISNSLVDIYLPTTTLLLATALYIGVRVWRKSH